MEDPQRGPWVEDVDRRSAGDGRPPLVGPTLDYAGAPPIDTPSGTPFVVFFFTGLAAAAAWFFSDITYDDTRRVWRAATVFCGLASVVLPILLQLRRSRP